MIRRAGSIVVVMVIGVLAVALAAAASQTQTARTTPSSPLDGTRWSVKVVPDAAAAAKGEKVFDDDIVFQDGKVTMTACEKYGFGASAYTTDRAGEHLHNFRTEQTSADQGRTVWTGSAKGRTIRGKMVWTKPDGTVLEYTFEGKRASS